MDNKNNKIRAIAIYLPQFHTIPENDMAWGKGFTEWTNVKKAKPLFEGHYQPHIPHEDVGYYDLSNPEIMVRQAAMAKEYGIHGFAFYHYWFNGKRLLETPLDNMLKTGTPDFPFLYIWANEPWSKRWDGSENEIIQHQFYSFEDDLEHIRFLCKNVFSDKRYIKIDNKPVFMVYRTELLPNVNETARIWRNEAKKNGFKDLYLIRVENFKQDINPIEIGFDASMEFAPDWQCIDTEKSIINKKNDNRTHDYLTLVENMSMKPDRNFPWFRCVTPCWDNSPRKNKSATTFINNTPFEFEQFFYRAITFTKKKITEDSQFVFINAWNEWGEGCHLEPDKKNGYAYLEAIKNVLDDTNNLHVQNYIEFIERNLIESLRRKEEMKEELNLLKIPYEKIMNSKPHKFIEMVLKNYRYIKRNFKK